MIESLIGITAVLLLIFLRVPIGLAMGLCGFFGFAISNGLWVETGWVDFRWKPVLSLVANQILSISSDYSLSVIPLFILMGNFVSQSGLSKQIYHVSYAFLGHYRGGLAMASVTACGIFSSICGSSLATAATMSRVAIPEMRRYGYSNRLAAASVAAGGTLGILIPPSVILVIYGIISGQSIRELFAAGFIPGMIGIVFYLLAVKWVVWRNPKAGPAGKATPRKEKLLALTQVQSTLLLLILVIGGIYLGVFTPTEAASVGSMGAFLIALFRKTLNWNILLKIASDSVKTSASLFAILFGALIFAAFIERTGFPVQLAEIIIQAQLAPLLIIIMILLIYIALGMVMESLSMILLTVPVFYPIVAGLGFDLVWFGIIVVVVTEISLITPPIGLNVFVLGNMLPDIKISEIFKGITPFWLMDIARLLLLTLFPGLSLFLPQLFYGG